MSKRMLIVVSVLALAVSSLAVQASFVDNFDGYAPGTQLHGVNGWKGWDNVAAAGALTSNVVAASPSNSVAITGGSDLVHEFPPTPTSGQWNFTCKQYVPGNVTGSSYLIFMNTYNDGGPYNWSAQLNIDMTAGNIVDDMAAGASLPIVRDRWVDLRFVIDLDANSVTKYYDGALLSTGQWYDPAGGAAAIDAIDLFANSTGPVYYDDISVQPVPEPAAIGLLAIGALALIRRRR